LGVIRVQSTHTPEIVEETKEHLVFKNKVSNEITGKVPDFDAEPESAPVIPSQHVSEISPIIPESSVHLSVASSEVFSEAERDAVTSSSPIESSQAINELWGESKEEKKKVILKAIEETRSREENLRILEERLRELRGDTRVETTLPAVETQQGKPSEKPVEDHTISIPTDSFQEAYQAESFETIVEVIKPDSDLSDTSEIAEVKKDVVYVPTETAVEDSPPANEHLAHLEIPEDLQESESFVEEAIVPDSESEKEKHGMDFISPGDSSKTFTEWLSVLSGKKR
jgi:hypothetical protein